ncbi:hypothetical protein SDC9_173529 [bioreactor metagenome]|uniref:Uncharacterized protein n=1 Tax=bioreactor metagenome TaxID=1076179 RepID=A0A645GHD8_9ZZZZ
MKVSQRLDIPVNVQIPAIKTFLDILVDVDALNDFQFQTCTHHLTLEA